MFRFFIKKKLSAYIDGELDKHTAEKIKRYIDTDPAIRREYEELKSFIALGDKFASRDVPDDPRLKADAVLKNADDPKIKKMVFTSGRRRSFALQGLGVAAVLVFIFYYTTLEQEETISPSGSLDLESYILSLEAVTSAPEFAQAYDAIPENFQVADPGIFIRQPVFRFQNIPAASDLSLTGHNTSWIEGRKVTHIVFRSAKDALALFITPGQPEDVLYTFGARQKNTFTIGSDPVKIIESSDKYILMYTKDQLKVTMISTIWDADVFAQVMSDISWSAQLFR